jgi:hypothetical protein
MAEVILKKKQIEVLKATIGDETYSIPLASSVPYLTLKNMRTDEKVIEFFKEYIPEDVFNGLLTDEIMQLVKAWNDATQEATGASVGES